MLNYFLIAVFFGYLIFESVRSYREVRSINAFSLGIRSISTYALGATITATWLSGSGFILDLTEFYTRGILYFLESIGMIFGLIIMAIVLVPRMERYLGKISVATIMGEEYGPIVRVITAFCGCLVIAGGLYIQFKIMGQVLFYLFPYGEQFYWTCGSSLIVIAYTYSGGINSVVHTDKIQALCFMISLIIGAILIQTNVTPVPPNPNILNSLGEQFTFSYFGTRNSQQLLESFLIFAYFIVPGLSPQTVQRISMGIHIKQVKKAYLWSSFWLLIVLFLSCFISYMIYQTNPNLDRDGILPYLLKIFSIDGTRAILAIGIISMCMSTADSNLNIGAILLANDTYKCNTLTSYQKLEFARFATISLGVISLAFCYKQGSFLQLLLFSKTFYVPLITVPLWAVIFKFKTTQRCCLITMLFTAIYIVIYKFILHPDLNIIVYAMVFNGITLFSTHYIVEKWELLRCFGIRSKLKN
jgi:Na+/proline symporter